MNNIYYQSEYWNSFPKSDFNTVAKDLNGSWDSEKQQYLESTPIQESSLRILQNETKMNKVLDFGCGMGRNLNYLKDLCPNVFGFDTSIMLSNLMKTQNFNYNYVTEEFEKFGNYAPFDFIYECTVLQHMPPQEVLFRLMQMKHLTKYIYITTRSYNDMFRDFQNQKGGVNLMKLIDSLNLWEIIDCSIPKEKAGLFMDETHYSMLLKLK
jgi:SAM-dependent methyltransferase